MSTSNARNSWWWRAFAPVKFSVLSVWGIVKTFGLLCFLRKNTAETIKERCHSHGQLQCLQEDWCFLEAAVFQAKYFCCLYCTFITYSVFISVFAFFIILCKVAKLAGTAALFDLASSEYIPLPLQIRWRIL